MGPREVSIPDTFPNAALLAAPQLTITGRCSFVLAVNGGLGDLCLALQVLTAFKNRIPERRKHEWVLALPRAASAMLPLIADLGLFDVVGELESATELLHTLRYKPILLPALLATSVNEARLARGSMASHLWALWGMASPFVPPPSAARRLERRLAARYEELRVARGFPKAQRFALFAPESNYLSGLKTWPVAHWRKLARLIVGTKKLSSGSIVVCASPATFETVRRNLPLPVSQFDWTDTTLNRDTRNYASVIASASQVISLDSGTAHLASLVGARCVSLWGPTPPAIYASPNAIAIRTSLCPPCDADARSRLCSDNVCMKNILPASVVEVLERLRSS
jgi:ADP-heptose:LPS heptosyltransferase